MKRGRRQHRDWTRNESSPGMSRNGDQRGSRGGAGGGGTGRQREEFALGQADEIRRQKVEKKKKALVKFRYFEVGISTFQRAQPGRARTAAKKGFDAGSTGESCI